MVISFPEFLEYIDEISVTPWCRDAHFFIPSPTVVNDSLYFCQGDLAIVLLWPIPIDDFCHEFVLFKWQNFRENLASIPHFPEHETKTVYITSGAVLAWLKYFGCCINHTTLGYFIPTDNANVWKLNTFIWSNLKQRRKCVVFQEIRYWMKLQAGPVVSTILLIYCTNLQNWNVYKQ